MRGAEERRDGSGRRQRTARGEQLGGETEGLGRGELGGVQEDVERSILAGSRHVDSREQEAMERFDLGGRNAVEGARRRLGAERRAAEAEKRGEHPREEGRHEAAKRGRASCIAPVPTAKKKKVVKSGSPRRSRSSRINGSLQWWKFSFALS